MNSKVLFQIAVIIIEVPGSDAPPPPTEVEVEQVVYSATMTVGSTTQNPIPLFGWDGDASLLENDALTDAYFVYANETYEFIRITTNATSGGVLYIAFDATNSGSISDAAVRSVMTLYVDGTAFALGDALMSSG